MKAGRECKSPVLKDSVWARLSEGLRYPKVLTGSSVLLKIPINTKPLTVITLLFVWEKTHEFLY